MAALSAANEAAGAALAAVRARLHARLRHEDAEVEVGRKQQQARAALALPPALHVQASTRRARSQTASGARAGKESTVLSSGSVLLRILKVLPRASPRAQVDELQRMRELLEGQVAALAGQMRALDDENARLRVRAHPRHAAPEPALCGRCLQCRSSRIFSVVRGPRRLMPRVPCAQSSAADSGICHPVTPHSGGCCETDALERLECECWCQHSRCGHAGQLEGHAEHREVVVKTDSCIAACGSASRAHSHLFCVSCEGRAGRAGGAQRGGRRAPGGSVRRAGGRAAGAPGAAAQPSA